METDLGYETELSRGLRVIFDVSKLSVSKQIGTIKPDTV